MPLVVHHAADEFNWKRKTLYFHWRQTIHLDDKNTIFTNAP